MNRPLECCRLTAIRSRGRLRGFLLVLGRSHRKFLTGPQGIARIEASDPGVDTRFIVTNLKGLEHVLYEVVCCTRRQAENLIKAHKLHLASDRTSCTRATANQFRLLIHAAAYWLMNGLRGLAPEGSGWCTARFDTLRCGLIKVAARVTEMVTQIKVSLPTSFASQPDFALIASALAHRPP